MDSSFDDIAFDRGAASCTHVGRDFNSAIAAPPLSSFVVFALFYAIVLDIRAGVLIGGFLPDVTVSLSIFLCRNQ